MPNRRVDRGARAGSDARGALGRLAIVAHSGEIAGNWGNGHLNTGRDRLLPAEDGQRVRWGALLRREKSHQGGRLPPGGLGGLASPRLILYNIRALAGS